jgi:transcriptional/translational regulatory protein YebC/TACO1
MVPSATVPLGTSEEAKKVLNVVEALDDHDDVQTVSANFDIPDDVLEAVSA